MVVHPNRQLIGWVGAGYFRAENNDHRVKSIALLSCVPVSGGVLHIGL